MDLSEMEFDNARPFDGYGPGFFRIGGRVIEGALVLHPGGILPWGGLADVATPMELAGKVDVICVGTGAEIAHLPPDLRAAADEVGLGLEAMNSPAACRTYNVLVSEGRRVAAAVLPVG
ncbi:Mth938-like domain-containing protein [Jannaschia sp. S6380]|uniref:Mth938-like domain-containing protein n=1 Tax=Jannaschia sp. S6380 TaxID=2926408 RepID=UPI001FF54075|nr:Mth938-like domain-containing protein [Jannaschia sp. S6380]MCK0167807.1 Mth938-like domain-containing protein [Jannaschia sp. S6380]